MTPDIRPCLFATMALVAATAQAAPETFLGADLGLGQTLRLPSHPLADAARDAFLARLQADVPTQSFEAVAVSAPLDANRSISLTFGAQSAVPSGLARRRRVA